MKKHLFTHQFLSCLPVIFFVIFLHPLYAVSLFEHYSWTIILFRLLTLFIVGLGVIGTYLYGQVIITGLKAKQLNNPSLWYLLPLNIVSLTIIAKFLFQIVFAL